MNDSGSPWRCNVHQGEGKGWLARSALNQHQWGFASLSFTSMAPFLSPTKQESHNIAASGTSPSDRRSSLIVNKHIMVALKPKMPGRGGPPSQRYTTHGANRPRCCPKGCPHPSCTLIPQRGGCCGAAEEGAHPSIRSEGDIGT